MFKAGALIYSVFISFLLAVICGLLITFSLIWNKNFISVFKREVLLDNVYSGINVALYSPDLLYFDQKEKIDLYDDSENIVELEKKSWGAYEIIKAKSRWSHFSENKIALVGIDWRKDENIALCLADKNNYLYVSGNTRLKGDCFVPGSQVKTAYIEGRDFSGKQPVDGEISRSLSNLPLINQRFIDVNSKYLDYGEQIRESLH